MKNLTLLAFTAVTLLTTKVSTAQDAVVGCEDKPMRIQAEMTKQDFRAQGMDVLMDAMVNMISKKDFPMAVRLEAHHLYQIVFIAKGNADKIELELYDTDRQKIAKKVVNNSGGDNMIVYSFMPSRSGVHGVIVKQKVAGQKEICGSLTIMEKSPDVKEEPLQ